MWVMSKATSREGPRAGRIKVQAPLPGRSLSAERGGEGLVLLPVQSPHLSPGRLTRGLPCLHQRRDGRSRPHSCLVQRASAWSSRHSVLPGNTAKFEGHVSKGNEATGKASELGDILEEAKLARSVAPERGSGSRGGAQRNFENSETPRSRFKLSNICSSP